MKIDKAKIRTPENSNDEKNSTQRVSLYTEDYRKEYYNISVEKLIPFQHQARKFFDEEAVNMLAENIKEHGVRQPLTVIAAENEKGKYEIVSGERRYRAAIKAGLKSVPCIIIHDRNKAEEIALIENIHREDLHPIELGGAYKQLLDKNLYPSPLELSKKLSITKTIVYEYLGYLKIDPEIQLYLIKNNIRSKVLIRKILKASNKEEQYKVLGIGEKVKSISIFRVNLLNHELKVEQKGLQKITKPDKVKLIEILEKTIENLKQE